MENKRAWRATVLLTVSAAGALAGVLLVPSASSASLLQRLPQTGRGRPFSRSRSTRNVRAPGDNGVGGHGIGGQLCWYEINKESGLGEWTCPPSVAAQPARRARLFDFGVTAPAEGYAYAGALPPTDWGDENFDGANFAAFSVEDSDMTGIPSYAHMDGDYWGSVHGGVPTALPLDLDEGVGPIFSDESWNTNIWCPSGICDYTEDTEPGNFDIDNYAAPVSYRPL